MDAGAVSLRRSAYVVILLFGIVSLCGDIIYEGARSVTGPYLYLLGGSALVVGLVAGLGEFLGYAIRLVSGYLADTTKRYWTITFIGYGLLIAVPFLALAGSWELAALLFITERIGKGIRAPAKDAILSNVAAPVGRGWGFAVHEALDQVGAVAGPLIFTAVYLVRGDFRGGFALLAIPFVLMMVVLVLTRQKAPDPGSFEAPCQDRVPSSLLPYGVFTALTMAGFAAFPLISYHFALTGTVPEAEIPLLYAAAMGVDAVVALAAGRLYDRSGLMVLIVAPLFAVAVPFLAFQTAYAGAVAAVVLWGAAMGVQETVLRAALADFTHISKRGTAYGVFNTIYGASWFAGSLFAGWAYEVSLSLLVVVLTALEAAAFVSFWWVRKSICIVS